MTPSFGIAAACWFIEEALAAWSVPPRKMPGGPAHDSRLAIEKALTDNQSMTRRECEAKLRKEMSGWLMASSVERKPYVDENRGRHTACSFRGSRFL
jgi:hypothetical protein